MKLLAATLLILFTACPLIGQDSTTFSNEDILLLYNGLRELEITDSLKTIKIDLLETKVQKYEQLVIQDSVIVELHIRKADLLQQEIEVYRDYIKSTRSSNKYLWTLYGAGIMVLSSWIVSNVK